MGENVDDESRGDRRRGAKEIQGENERADTDENEDGRVCVGGLARSACALLLLKARLEHQRPAAVQARTACNHHVQARSDDGTRLLIAARTAAAKSCMYLRCGAAAKPTAGPNAAAVSADAGRSAIARVESKCG